MYKALKIKFEGNFVSPSMRRLFDYGTTLNFYGKKIRILSDDERVINRVNQFYYYFVDGEIPESNHKKSEIALVFTNKISSAFNDIADYYNLPPKPERITLFSFDRFAYYFINFEFQYFFTGIHIRNRMVHRLFDQYIFIHGAALSKGKRTLLLPGAAAIGKTTVSFLLLKNGYRIITDDLIMLSRKDFHLYPFPVLLNFRENTIQNLSELSSLRDKAPDVMLLNEKRWFYRPQDNEIENQILPLENIFIINSSDDFKTNSADRMQFIFNMLPHIWFPVHSGSDIVSNSIDILNVLFDTAEVDCISSNDFYKTCEYIMTKLEKV